MPQFEVTVHHAWKFVVEAENRAKAGDAIPTLTRMVRNEPLASEFEVKSSVARRATVEAVAAPTLVVRDVTAVEEPSSEADEEGGVPILCPACEGGQDVPHTYQRGVCDRAGDREGAPPTD